MKPKLIASRVNIQFNPKRWTLIAPDVVNEFWRDGVRYYDTSDGKLYVADIYDLKLRPQKIENKKQEEDD